MLNIEHWAACYIVNYFTGRLSFSESFSDFTESLVTLMYSVVLSYYRSRSILSVFGPADNEFKLIT